MFFRLPCAENQTEWRFFCGLLLVLLEPSEVQLHLALVCCSKLTMLQIYGQQPSQAAMVEQQVQIIVLGVNGYPFLPRNKAEVRAEFQ